MKSYKEWIFIAKFSGNLTTVVIVNYSLQEGTEEAEEDNTKMIDAIKETPKPDLLLVMGDFNAHIGKEDARFTYHERTKKNRTGTIRSGAGMQYGYF